MKIRINFPIIILTIGLSCCFWSCNKDSSGPEMNSSNTIFPLPYFPVYPGSYWRYVDSFNDTSLVKTAPEYQLDSYTTREGTSEAFYVPVYNDIPIWGYKEHSGPVTPAYGNPILIQILSDTLPVGSSWLVYSSFGTAVSRRIVAKDTTVAVAGQMYYPTIVVESYFSQGPGFYIWITKKYYTKDVGLIRTDILNHSDSTINTLELIDYYINI